MSVLLGGGGIAGGEIVGSSNAKGERPQEQPLKPADVLATIYRTVGVDLDAAFLNHAGRPTRINNYGEVIKQLIQRTAVATGSGVGCCLAELPPSPEQFHRPVQKRLIRLPI